MPAPRATSTEADELAASLSAMKSRLNELESVAGVGSVPVGAISDYVGTVAPTGWTLLDGGTITNGQSLYPALWAILPASFKSGSDIIKPDTRGRVTVHRAASGTLDVAIGTTGGDETVTLTTSQLPSHAHNMEHDHTMRSSINIVEGTGASTAVISTTGTGLRTSTARETGTATTKTNTGTAGSGSAHNNLQPYMVTVKIMRIA